jgi:hypothetical protein
MGWGRNYRIGTALKIPNEELRANCVVGSEFAKVGRRRNPKARFPK